MLAAALLVFALCRVGPAPPEAERPGDEVAASRDLGEALELEAGASCLDPELLSSAVQEFRGRPDVDGRVRLRVVGDSESSQVVRFEVRWNEVVVAQRTFDPAPESCDDLHAVVGVALAIAIDEDSLDAAIEAAKAAEPETTPDEPDSSSSENGPAPEPESRTEVSAPVDGGTASSAQPATPNPRLGVSLFADGVVFLGVIPQVSGGADAGVEVHVGKYVDVRGLAVGTLGNDRDFAGGRLDFALLGGELDVCGGGPIGWRVRPRACVGFLGAAMRWEARELDNPQSGRDPWLAVTGSAGLRAVLHPRVALALSVWVAAPVLQSRYNFDAQDETVTLGPPPVAGGVALGPVFRLR